MARANNRERIEAVAARCEEVEETLATTLRQAEEAQGTVVQARESMDAILEEARTKANEAIAEAQGAANQVRQDVDTVVEEAQSQARQNMDAIVADAQGSLNQARNDMDAVVAETRTKANAAVSEAKTALSQVIDEALVSKLGAAYNTARQRNQSAANWGYVAGIAALALSFAWAAITLITIPATGSSDLGIMAIMRLGVSVPAAAFAFYAFSVASKHRTKALQDEQYTSELTTLLALFDSLDPQQTQAQLGSLKQTLLENYFPGAKREMQLSKRPDGIQVNGKFLATAAGTAMAVILTLSALLTVMLAR